MAGARIEFDIDAGPAHAALQRAAASLDQDSTRLLLSDIGEYLLRSTRDRAAQQLSPSGQRWRALEPSYARWKGKRRPGVPILKFDNHMLGDQLSHQVEGTTLLVGTNAPYGAIHQFGGAIHIAARSQRAYFHHSKGEVSPQFVNQRKANFVQWVTLPAYTINMPARPWLGISDADADEIVLLTGDHLKAALS